MGLVFRRFWGSWHSMQLKKRKKKKKYVWQKSVMQNFAHINAFMNDDSVYIRERE